MFTLVFVAMCSLLLALAGPCLHAADYSSEERDWFASHKTLRAGFAVLHAPFSMSDQAGEPAGINRDMMNRLAGRVNLQVAAKHVGAGSEAIESMRNGEIDVIVGAVRTPELEKAFLFTEPFLSFPFAMIAEGDSVFYSSPARLAGRRVAVTSGSSTAAVAVGATPVPFDTLENALKAVAKGRVDVVLADPLEAGYVIQSSQLTGLKIVGSLEQHHELCIAVRRDWPELVSILNQSIATVSPREVQASCEAWAPSRPVAALGSSTLWYLLLGALLVCGFAGWYVLRRQKNHKLLRVDRSRLQRELTRSKELTVSLTGEKSRLLQLAAQEMFHPLADIKAQAEKLGGDQSTAAGVRESAMGIVVHATRIQKALDALREIQSLEEGGKAMNVTVVNIGAVVGEVMARLEGAAAKRRVRLSAPNAGKTALVMADVDVLRKVLESLLVGALKVAPPDSAVSVAFWPVSDRVLISVSDEGPGVSVADHSKVFGSYHQMGASLHGAENATGYGLALVENLVKAMRACLWYESTPGVGATYVIELPIGEAAPQATRVV